MPIPVITIAQMREWEAATWAAGQTETEVIQRVGSHVARRALSLTQPGDSVLIAAGKGNNGEDALAAIDHLQERQVNFLRIADPREAERDLDDLLATRPALVIDGLFGIGLSRTLSADWIRMVEKINGAKAQVLSVDVPSGLNAETGQPEGAAIRAAVTLTVGAPKTGMLRSSAWPYVGRLEIANDVGFSPCRLTSDVLWTTPDDFDDFPPRREVASHKGSHGHAGIIAGSLGFHGASVLAARAAQRAQPGLITLLTQEAVYGPVASQLQAVMVSPWRTGTALPVSVTAILVGPGLAAPDIPNALKDFTRGLWSECPVPVIVDASALDWLQPGPTKADFLRVITPHPGEAARLLGVATSEMQSDRSKALRELSSQFGNTWVVLKGHQTLIGRSTGEIYVNPTGNPHLAQGGSGDVLAGYLAGLLAQPALRDDVSKLFRYAVWQHGLTADHLQTTRRNWAVEDLVIDLGCSNQSSDASR